ncbi:Ankyrin repeat protein [Giardia duodenalis]|uniref:Ankyrin repeat protein n=1 Tax=Giardia intestinalis TaxID=5741 RepID=V6TS78_GIAIN|nr:Ankyrin repeat protein [Giardia intestinalis]
MSRASKVIRLILLFKRAPKFECANTMNGGNHEPAARNVEGDTSGVPMFTLRKLESCRGNVLGGGRFGKVYAINGFPGLAVKAIEIMDHNKKHTEFIERELDTISKLSHPNIVKCHQVLSNDDFFYVVMDRYHGDLQHFIADHKSVKKHIPRELMLSIMRQLADALAYVHAPYKVNERGDVLPGIVHRDLKPDNVLMNRDGDRVAIADFGLCKDVMHDGSTFAGTEPYMAPETFIYQKTSRASDIWALGVIIYELATLRLPRFSHHWYPEDAKEYFVDGWEPNLQPVKDGFIRNILKRIFVLDPEERPTAKELAELFQKPDIPVIELKAPVNVLDERCKSLEAALNGVNARLELLESSLRAKTDEIDSFKEALANKSAEIDALESTIATQAAEIDSLRKELKTKSAKIDALEQQFTGAIEALEEKTRRRKAKMDQQLAQVRTEADQHKKELEALKLANEHADKHDEEAPTPEAVDDSGVTALMKAAARNDVKVVKALITKQKKLRDSDGKTALMYAAQRGCKEAVKVLLEHEKGMRDNQSHTALYHGLRSGHMEVAKIVIPHEDPTDEKGVTALMRAAARGDAEMVELLVPLQKEMKNKDRNTAFVHALNNSHVDAALLLREYEAPSWTPLMCAASIGDVELAKKHLSDKDKKNSDGETALMIAAWMEHEDIVELLDPTDKDGNTALMRAIVDNNTELIELLAPLQKQMRNNEGYTALTIAAMEGRADIVQLLDPTDCNGVTALMRAAKKGDAKAVKALIPLQKGKRMIEDNYISGLRISIALTALMIAAAHGHVEAVKLLVEYESGLKDDYDQTALIHAARAGHRETVKLLMEHEKDVTGWTMLMCAAALGDVDMVSQHIGERGQKDKLGQTALILAAQNGRDDVVKFLMKYEGGASGWTNLIYAAYLGDVDAVKNNLHEKGCKDITGLTALMWAAQQSHREPVEVLLEYEGGMQDKDGRTALTYAADKGHTECVKLLLEKEGGMRDKEGVTALMLATLGGHTECARILAEREKEIKHPCGTAAFNLAEYRGFTEIVSILSK